jgi:hypothetical protein
MASGTAPRQRLATLLLSRPVMEFIAERRADDVPYRRIARDLRDATAGEIDVSDMTIRAWWLGTEQGRRMEADRKAAKEADSTRTAA